MPSATAQCQSTSGKSRWRRHEAERGRKVKSAEDGKERNTRVGIVPVLAAQPAQLPVICFVVNAKSQGRYDAAGHKPASVASPPDTESKTDRYAACKHTNDGTGAKCASNVNARGSYPVTRHRTRRAPRER